MLEELQLVEVSSENFTAVLPTFESQDADECMEILRRYYEDEDPQAAFDLVLRMFVRALADDKLDDFYTIPDHEIIQLVTNWMVIK